jgi:calcineurin-like phosphoesterase family protein
MAQFFTSDTHFGHANIIGYCNRPFSSTEEMDEALIQNWNLYVKPTDEVFHLGDFAFGSDMSAGRANLIRRRLNGSIYLIEGNHEKIAKAMRASSFAWIKHYCEIEIYKQAIVLFHYGMRTWHHDLRGTWHLFGHSHGGLTPYGKSFDIGVDCWNFRPLSFEEVKIEMDKREIGPAPGFTCHKCGHFPCACI